MIWHITPVDDLEPHSEESTCICNPKVQVLDNGDLLVTHNSFDEREIIEQISELLKNNL